MHFVFAKMRLAEEQGLGLKSMKSRALAEADSSGHGIQAKSRRFASRISSAR